MPVEQALVNQFLRMNIGAENPNCSVDPMSDGGDEKRLCRLGDLRELDRPLRSIDCAKFARDRLAGRNDLQKLSPPRFLHRLAVVEKQWKFKATRQKGGSASSFLSAAVLAVEFDRNV
jgi:hypothetical protein